MHVACLEVGAALRPEAEVGCQRRWPLYARKGEAVEAHEAFTGKLRQRWSRAPKPLAPCCRSLGEPEAKRARRGGAGQASPGTGLRRVCRSSLGGRKSPGKGREVDAPVSALFFASRDGFQGQEASGAAHPPGAPHGGANTGGRAGCAPRRPRFHRPGPGRYEQGRDDPETPAARGGGAHPAAVRTAGRVKPWDYRRDPYCF